MRTRRSFRSYVATAVAIGAITLSGCASDVNGREDGLPESGDFGDVDDLSTVFQNIDAADVNSVFTDSSGLLAVTLDDGKAVLFTKRAVDSAILVNGAPVLDSGKLATMTSVKKIEVVTATPGGDTDEQAIFDFLGGTFAVGTSSAIGIDVDLGGVSAGSDADEVSIRGTTATDAWYIGAANKLSLGNDDFADAEFAGVETIVLALAAGNDTFSATNVDAMGVAAAIKGVTGTSTIALTVYGGAGNDVVVGGGDVDNLWGGLGDDSLNGGVGADILKGEDGADTFLMGASDDTNTDVLTCGAGVDTVSYALRTAAVIAKLGTSTGFTVQDTLNDDCDNLTGGAGNDHLYGGSIANVITGGAGDDALSGGAGNDTLNGDAGNDTFVEGLATAGALVVGAGEDLMNGGAGMDTVSYGVYAAVTSTSPAITARTASLTVTMDGTTANDGETNEKDNVKADVENIVVGAGGGSYTGNLSNNVFHQGSAANGGDVMSGLVGIDTVDYSGRGTGIITATMGDDLANDGTGELDNIKNDIENLLTGGGVDVVTGNDLDNYIDVGAGANQTVHCDDGDDIAVGTTVTVTSGCEILEN